MMAKVVQMKHGNVLVLTPRERGEAAARSGLPVTATPYDSEELKQQWYGGWAAYMRRTQHHAN